MKSEVPKASRVKIVMQQWFCTGCCSEQPSSATEKCTNRKCQLARVSVGIDNDMRRSRKRTAFLLHDDRALFDSSFGSRSIARKPVKRAKIEKMQRSIISPPVGSLSNLPIDAVDQRMPLSPIEDVWRDQDFEDLLQLKPEDIVAFIIGDYCEGDDSVPLS